MEVSIVFSLHITGDDATKHGFEDHEVVSEIIVRRNKNDDGYDCEKINFSPDGFAHHVQDFSVSNLEEVYKEILK